MFGAIFAGLTLAGCGGGSKTFSEQSVIDAFARVGVELSVAIRPGPSNNPLEVILESALNDTCQDSDGVTVNVFGSEGELRDFLERAHLAVTTEWRRLGEMRGRRFGNLLVALNAPTKCATQLQIDAALAALA